MSMNKKFNPLYDSNFKIINGQNEPRYLVEMYCDELEQLKYEIELLLKKLKGE